MGRSTVKKRFRQSLESCVRINSFRIGHSERSEESNWITSQEILRHSLRMTAPENLLDSDISYENGSRFDKRTV